MTFSAFPQKRVDAYLREWVGVDPWVLAVGMAHHFHRPMPVRYIMARQRALGLRKCVAYVAKGKRR
jgi:hypothetical protein